MMRKIAATLGVSYAELSRDFTKGSYSSAKAEVALAERTSGVKKKVCAERIATQRYQLWFEEEMAAGNLPLPPGRNRTDFYRPLMKDAYTRCAWIGTGRGQIDELKETQAAMLRIKAGLSTFEDECAKLGRDYREVFAQRAKEDRHQKKLGLTFTLDASRDGNNAAGDTITQDDPNNRGRNDDDEE
jgi:lambda family phage portal protein